MANEKDAAGVKLDPTIHNPKARCELVQKVIESTPSELLTPYFLEILSNYILFDKSDKQGRKKREILTDNRMVTVNKRETSYEGLVQKFENGEDGIYNMIIDDKNVILTPKVTITDEDLQEMPELKKLHDAIVDVEKQMAAATGKRKFLLKKQIIEMRKDQYVIRNSYKPRIYMMNLTKSSNSINFNDETYLDENGEFHISGFSFCNPDIISLLLCNYSKMKEDTYAHFTCDGYYMMMDFENLVDEALKDDYPVYYDIMIFKIDGKTNEEIQQLIKDKYGTTHSIEYISSLWRRKIPKLIADKAEKKFVYWWYTEKIYGKWKRCSRCGQIKPAHNLFFSKNNTSKDGWYSICKDCRNAKTKEKVRMKMQPISRKEN